MNAEIIARALRFHPRLKHPTGGMWPGLVALITRGTDDLPLAVHRTFLSCEGTGKAPVDPQKMMLGPCRGGAVRLAVAEQSLMVGEGIETCLAAMEATGRPAWAALSTSELRTLELPAEVRDVIVLADGDEPGEAAALDAARRWKREGRHVCIARPPRGMDFNDVLLSRTDLELIRATWLEPPNVIKPGKLHRFPGIGKRTGNTSCQCSKQRNMENI